MIPSHSFNPHLRHFIDFRTEEGIGVGGEGGQPGAGERPDWLEPQFQSVDDQARSYAEARKEMDRLRTEAQADRQSFNAALERMQAEQEQRAQQAQHQQPAYDPQQDPMLATLENAYLTGDMRTVTAIQVQLAAAASQQAIAPVLAQQFEEIKQALGQNVTNQRDLVINQAEEQVRAQAMQAGLDYDASREDIIGAIQALGGMPEAGNLASYTDFIGRAVRLVHADAVLNNTEAQIQQRVDKLSLATLVPGARARVATGTPEEKQEWDAIKGARSGSYSEIMGPV